MSSPFKAKQEDGSLSQQMFALVDVRRLGDLDRNKRDRDTSMSIKLHSMLLEVSSIVLMSEWTIAHEADNHMQMTQFYWKKVRNLAQVLSLIVLLSV